MFERPKVRCIDLGVVYNSAEDAADILGLHKSNITACCTGRRAKCGGYRFEYVDPEHIHHTRKGTRLSYADENRVVKMYMEGVPIKKIAETVGIQPPTIYVVLKRRKIGSNRYFRILERD